MTTLRRQFLAATAALLVTASTGAQDLTPEARERAERAHRTAQRGNVPASEAAEKLTSQAAGMRPGETPQAQAIARKNFIDEHIFGRIEKDGIPHAGRASDREFVRRAYLDVTGRIPTINELTAFLDDKHPGKRSELIDTLVDSEEFVQRWSYYFEDLFRAGNRMGFGKNLFHYWIEEWLRLDRPYSGVVADLLTQGGKSSHSSPGALYFARDFVKAKDDPDEPDAHDLINRADSIDEFTITYSKVFLGINLGCISCHDGAHHLERINLFLTGKTREQFFQQAAFYGKTRMLMNWENGFQANTEYTVDDVEPGYPTEAESIVRVPRTGGDNTPRFILSGEAARPGRLPRDELARFVTGSLQFSRATVNRIWAQLMGFGIVEPVDDFDLARYYADQEIPEGWIVQPSNPHLLDDLAKDFQKSNYSFKHLVRTIMKSSAYQLSSKFEGEWKPAYAAYYPRKFVRILSATELHDAIAVATSRPGSYKKGDEEVRMARQLIDPAYVTTEVAEFFRAFGQQSRDEMPSRSPTSALQAMLMMNSEFVLDRVKAEGNSRVDQLLERIAEDRVVVEQAYRAATGEEPSGQAVEAVIDRSLVDRIYLSTLSRQALPAEMDVALSVLGKNRAEGLENLQWALLNKPEFLFNY
ncbi:MAG: DUF1553 domain-containing protein [Planctomycetota bacterium]|nr:DUF1553 domain-containing protein [Planctomycetota bacterium]